MIKRDLDFSRNPTKTKMVISIVRASKLETSHWLSLRALEALQKEGCWLECLVARRGRRFERRIKQNLTKSQTRASERAFS